MNANRKSNATGNDPIAALLDGTSMLIISRIREGIPVSCLRKLASTLGMNVPQFLSAVGMSKISVERRSKGERVLTVNGGNLLVRIAQVYRISSVRLNEVANR